MSVSSLTWAMERNCDTPLEKLVLMYCANAFGMHKRWKVMRTSIAEFCCTDEDIILQAVRDLDMGGHIRWHGFNATWIDIELLYVPDLQEAATP